MRKSFNSIIFKNMFVLFSYHTVIGLFLFIFLFVFQAINPNFYFCSQLIDYNLNFNFIFPESCDQNYYFEGFMKFSNVFNEDFNYQSRPLYILLVNLVYSLFTNFFDLGIFNFYISIFLSQIFITSLSSFLIYSFLSSSLNFHNISKLYLTIFMMLNPLVKWGIFDPSHQLLTILVIVFNVWLIEKNYFKINYKFGLLFGFLVLLHREFLVSYFALLVYKTFKENNKFKFLSKNYFYLIFSTIPTLTYNIYISQFLGRSTYDANSEYWGQFIWIAYFILGKKKFESDWHCVEIPDNFICYFQDNILTLIYLIVPFVLVVLNFLFLKVKQKKLLSLNITVLTIFLFWSLIGWYPPIRFSFYSIGNLVILLNIFIFFNTTNKILRYTHLLSYSTYCLFINHWNYENIIEINYGIVVSIFLLVVYSYFLKREKKDITRT